MSVKVQKWSIKMMHLYKDDHIKDVQSTCRGSCNTRMECWWLTTSSTLGSFWYSTSRSVHSEGKTKVSLSSPFLLAVLLWSRQTRSKNTTPCTGSRLLPAWSQQFVSNPSDCPFFHQHSVCVCSFCVGVFYSALPLYKSTVARGSVSGHR